jgi:hypothetical protein
MDYPINAIKGLDASTQAKLAEAGVTTTNHLLAKAGSYEKRNILARMLGIDVGNMTEWVNRADLMRLNGISTEMANLLEACGVNSCKELQHRAATTLYSKLKAVNDLKQIAHHTPPLAQVEAWIIEAAKYVAQPTE